MDKAAATIRKRPTDEPEGRPDRRALLRRARAAGVPTLDDHDLAAIIDHRCADYVRRTRRLPTLRDAAAEDYGDPGRLRLAAAIELGRRTLAEPKKQDGFDGPRKTGAYLTPRYGSQQVEHIGVLLLDTHHRMLEGGDVVLGRGTLDETLAPPRDILRAVVRSACRCFVLWHNHPSGDPTPSEEDRAITDRMCTAAQAIGVDLVDHIIVSEASYYSFQEHGRL